MMTAFCYFLCAQEHAGNELTVDLFPEEFLLEECPAVGAVSAEAIGADKDTPVYGPIGSIRARYQKERMVIKSLEMRASNFQLTNFIHKACDYGDANKTVRPKPTVLRCCLQLDLPEVIRQMFSLGRMIRDNWQRASKGVSAHVCTRSMHVCRPCFSLLDCSCKSSTGR